MRRYSRIFIGSAVTVSSAFSVALALSVQQILTYLTIFNGDPLVYNKKEGKKARRKGYWFPYGFKYLGWLLAISVMAVSSALLILYGLTFGLIKCYLWITAVVMSFCAGLIVMQPIKICFISYCFAQIIKSPPSLRMKRIPENVLTNPYDDKKALLALRRRLEYSQHYSPLPKYKLETRAQNIKYHLEQRQLFVDVAIFTVFACVLTYMVTVHKSPSSYYSTEVVKHLVVHGSYTRSISLMDVISYNGLIEYLNKTLIPALFPNPNDQNRWGSAVFPWKKRLSKSEAKKLKKRSPPPRRPMPDLTARPTWKQRDRLIVLKRVSRAKLNEGERTTTKVYDRSWTMDPAVKLIGKARIRQLRVKNSTCPYIEKIKLREELCFGDFSHGNQEYGDFTLFWHRRKHEVLTPMAERPWKYESAWKTGSVYLIAKYGSYPGGGYVLDLAKRLNDSQLILSFMDAFQWIDARTRAVIIEFTLYSVNVNLFNVVYLIIERSASGYFITSYQINTAKFMFLADELEIITVIFLAVFIVLLMLYSFRQAIRIGRTSFRSYISEGNTIDDILIILLGILSISFIFLRSYYVSSLLQTIEQSQNYEFVSFSYAAVWDTVSTYINTILICLAAVKLFKLLRFRVVFLQLQETLRGCHRYFLALGIQLTVILCGFAFLFHIILVSYDYNFSTFGLSLSTLIGRIFSLDDTFDFSVFSNTPWFMAPLFYGLFVIIVSILFLSFFVSVICFYMGRVKNTRLMNKYNPLAYLKHVLTANRNTDILRLKGGAAEYADYSSWHPLLRLRGGGAACARCCFGDEEKYKLPSKYMVNREYERRTIPPFTRKKVYDFSVPRRLDGMYRLEAMKKFTQSHLESSQWSKRQRRNEAMNALVAHYLNAPYIACGEKYYKVIEDDKVRYIPNGRVLAMKEIVDSYGRNKMTEIYAKSGLQLIIVKDDITDYRKNVKVLARKLDHLRAALERKLYEERMKRIKERRAFKKGHDVRGREVESVQPVAASKQSEVSVEENSWQSGVSINKISEQSEIPIAGTSKKSEVSASKTWSKQSEVENGFNDRQNEKTITRNRRNEDEYGRDDRRARKTKSRSRTRMSRSTKDLTGEQRRKVLDDGKMTIR